MKLLKDSYVIKLKQNGKIVEHAIVNILTESRKKISLEVIALDRNKISLNGLWNFQIPQGKTEKRMVPGSYHCVGDSIYSYEFYYDKHSNPPDTRTLVCFEGIAYEGTVFLNGIELGTMLPYSYYEFDATDSIQNGSNQIFLKLMDINAIFGPAEGWRSYSGIVRDVYLQTVAPIYIEDVFFHTSFKNNYHMASCTIEVTLNGSSFEDLSLKAELCQRGKTVTLCSHTVQHETENLYFDMDTPLLWSPENPFLYELTVRLIKAGTELDQLVRQVGFKEFTAKKNKFYLNDQPIFLSGVCRHDLQTDHDGFTQTAEQIEKDMQMIKSTGSNYVRLVHYPHDRRVIEAADRIGLFVSEEPGLWWSDLNNAEITSRALKVLERVILRDRSNVSIVFWLSFNECVFTKEFLRDAASITHKLDPTRLVSGANCMSLSMTKELFDEQGFDFYTFHPYGSWPDTVTGGYGASSTSLAKIAKALSDKPLIFTEWGGFFVNDNPALFTLFCEEMIAMSRNESPAPVLAGMSYWSWQDIYEANRGTPCCIDGILNEGLVTVDRVPKMNYDTFTRALSRLHYTNSPPSEVVLFNAGDPGEKYHPVSMADTEAKNQEEAWAESIKRSIPVEGMFHKKERRFTNGPILPHPITALGNLDVCIGAGRPFVVNDVSGSITVPIRRAADAIYFIGQCSLCWGYPINGKHGDEVGQYVIHYIDGSRQIIPIRNGIELATVQGLHGPSAIDPRASSTSRAFSIKYDMNWEIYYIGLLKVAANNKKVIADISFTVTDSHYSLLLYGITLKP